MKFFNFHLMPYRHADLDAIEKHGTAWVTYSNRDYDPEKGAELYHEYLDQMEFADTARLRRRLPQRAPPDRLRHDADPGRARRRAGALGQARQDRDPRPRAAAAQQSAGGRGRIRDARQPHARPLHRRLRARHRRRVPRHGHQPGVLAGALRRGARPDHPRLDRARAVPVRRQALPLQLREHLAAALSDAASADLDSVAGLEQHDQMGGADALHLRADAGADRGGGEVLPALSRRGREGRLLRPRPTSSPGRTPSTSPRPTRRRCARRKPHLEALANRFLKMPTEMLLPPGYSNIEFDEAHPRRQGHRQAADHRGPGARPASSSSAARTRCARSSPSIRTSPASTRR